MQTVEKDYTYQLDPAHGLRSRLEPWRNKLIEWAYEVVDHFKYNRDIVSLTFKLFDRYVVLNGVTSKKEAQLLSMTSLYLAIKVSASSVLEPSLMSQLSRGLFKPEQIEEMEKKLIFAIKYRINPPLESDYLGMLNLLLCEIDDDLRNYVIDIVKYLTELSIHDSYFIGSPSSYVVFAALVATLEHEVSEGRLTQDDFSQFFTGASELFNFDANVDDTKAREDRDKRKVMTDRFGSLLAKIKDTLPRTEVDMWKFGSKFEPKNLNEDIECPICLENFKDEDEIIGMNICFHIFHSICLQQWFNTKQTCPVCRHQENNRESKKPRIDR